MNKLDKIFNIYFLLLLNEIIIITAFAVENGAFFFRTGLIHGIAILFIILAISRIFFYYYTYDPVLEKFIKATLFALTIFALSHIIEFTSMVVFKSYSDTIFANVANLYLISIFSIIIGIGYFVKIEFPVYTKILRQFSLLGIIILVLTSLSFVLGNSISLEATSLTPYIYALVLLLVGGLAIIEMTKVKKLTSVAKGFANYLVAAIILIVLSALINVFYEVSLTFLGIAEYISTYMAHFIFYAALSLCFLSFQKLSYLGGVYEDIKK